MQVNVNCELQRKQEHREGSQQIMTKKEVFERGNKGKEM